MHGLLVDIVNHRHRSRQQPALRDLSRDEPDEQEAHHGKDRNEGPAKESRPGYGVGAGEGDAHGLPPCQNVPGASSVPGPTSFSPPSSRRN